MRKFTIAAGMLLCAATAMPAFAQDDAQPGAAQSAPSFSDEQLKSFAQAAVKVQIITQQAQMQMMQAVQSVPGVDMQTYNSIVQQAQKDPALASKISGFMKDYAKDAGIPTTGDEESEGE